MLDGFDLGAGALYPFIAKGEDEKRLVRASIGPVWDGNEVWLLTGGGAIFAAFPAVYAATFSGFYLAIMLVLFGLILRAVSLEFRHRDESWHGFWDFCFFVGSLVPALLVGVALGNVIRGIPLNEAGDYTGHVPGAAQPVLAARRRDGPRAAAHARRLVARRQGRGSGARAGRQVAHAALPRLRRARRRDDGGHDLAGSARLRQRARTADRLALHRGARRRAWRTRSGSSAGRAATCAPSWARR